MENKVNEFKFQLGETVKDIITGFQGVILARSQYLTSCNTYGLCKQEVPKGDSGEIKWTWFDEPRLVNIKNKKILSLIPVEREKTGGPHSSSEFAPMR